MTMIHNVLYDEKGSVIYFQIVNKQQHSSEEIIMDFSMKDVLPNVVSNDKCKSKGMLWESKLKDKYQFEVELNANIPVKNRIVNRNNKQYDMFLTILNESITMSQRFRNRVDKPFMLDILNDSIKYFKFIKQRSHMVAMLKIIKSYLINHFDCVILYKPSNENESRNNNNNNNNLSDRSYSNNNNNTLQSNKSYKSVDPTIINKHTRNETQLYRRLFRNHFLQKSNSNFIKTGEIPLTVSSVQQKEDITSSIVSKDIAQKEQSKNEVIFSYVGSNTTNMNKTNISNGLTTINNNNNSNINNNNTQIETRSNNSTITIHKIKPKVINLCKNNYLFYKPQSLKFSSNNKKEFTLDDEESNNSNNNTTSKSTMIKKKVISKAKSYIDIKHPNEKKMLCGFVDSYISKKNEKKEYEEYRKQLKARKGLQFYLDNIKRNEMLNPAYYIKLKERELRYEKYLQRQKLKVICEANGNKFYFMNVINNEQLPKKNNNSNKHN